jgi:hypothetical protein
MTSKAKTGKVNWYQAIAEVALIILGILGALAVDSWWDERSQQGAEIDYLKSLRTDFISTRLSLSEEIEVEKRILGIGKEIHANIATGLSQISTEELVNKISDFYWFSAWEWEPVTATYDELIGSGHLEYIQNKSLRIGLAQFRHLVGQLNDYRETQISTWQMTHRPFFYEHLIVSDMDWTGDYRPVSPFKNDVSELESKQFWNLVSDWMVSHNTMLWRYQKALESCDKIIAIIDSELATKADETQ